MRKIYLRQFLGCLLVKSIRRGFSEIWLCKMSFNISFVLFIVTNCISRLFLFPVNSKLANSS